MTNEQATRRYFRALIPATIALLGFSYGIKLADNAGLLPALGLYAAALLPVASMLVQFWAYWRYIAEIDEFLRSIQLRAAFVGLVVVMVVATGWGYLEFYAEAPALSIFWLNPLYWIAYGLAVPAITWRYGGAE